MFEICRRYVSVESSPYRTEDKCSILSSVEFQKAETKIKNLNSFLVNISRKSFIYALVKFTKKKGDKKLRDTTAL